MPLLNWKISKGAYVTGEGGFLGPWRCFSFFWDAGAPPKNDDGETLSWKLKCFLPGINPDLGSFLHRKEAKEWSEKVLANWIKQSGLTKEEV